MSKYVVDASAILALMHREAGAEYVLQRLPAAAISAVNYSEVVKKAVERGSDVAKAHAELAPLQLTIVPFDTELGLQTAALWSITRNFGLSFADRCCLALALKLRWPVLTADRRWSEVRVDLQIEQIR